MPTVSRASPTATVNTGTFSAAARSRNWLYADSEPRLLRPSLNTMTACTRLPASRFNTAVTDSGTLVPSAIDRATSMRFSILPRASAINATSASGSPAGVVSSAGNLAHVTAQSAVPGSLPFHAGLAHNSTIASGDRPRDKNAL